MKGKWITCEKEVQTPLFVKKIVLGEISSASIDISGLGYFTLFINGKAVTRDLFTPAQTDYANTRDLRKFTYPINDTLTHRVLYTHYDITRFLKIGENTVEVIVGNGWWRQTERVAEGNCSYSEELLLIYDIKVTDKDGCTETYSTDGTERVFVYPILESNLFLGETIDTRLFLSEFKSAEVYISDFMPDNFDLQTCPPDRVIETLIPKLINCGERMIYDVGKNISGVVAIKVKGKSGDKIILRFSEELENNELDFNTTGYRYRGSSGRQQLQSDCFVLNGEEQEIRPMFVWHGFRYFDMKMPRDTIVSDIKVEVIHTDVKVTSEFKCDNEVLNWIYNAFIRTQLNNIHGCVPSDCPTRERLGYTGDGNICSGAVCSFFDAADMYKKWIRDIIDCQDIHNGHIQHTAPFMGGGGGPGGWGGAIIKVPFNCYITYNDKEFLKMTYEPMKKWVEYMKSHCDDYILTHEEKDGWCLGDWSQEIGSKLISAEFANTCLMIDQLKTIALVADILGDTCSAEYLDFAEKCRLSLFNKFFSDGTYCNGIGAAEAFAIWAELPQHENLIRPLCERYSKIGYFDTGIFGTYILTTVLFSTGNGKLAVDLLTSDNPKCGFKAMMNRNATTLYELLDLRGTADHPMFGASAQMLLKGLLGINASDLYMQSHIVYITPCLDSVVKKAEGSVLTPEGRISVKFNVESEKIIDIEIPNGVKACFNYGATDYTLSPGLNHIVL